MNYLLIFVLAAITDAVWAGYIMYCAKKEAFKAAVFGGLIMGISAYITMAYLEEPKVLIVAILGGGVGTYLTVKYTK